MNPHDREPLERKIREALDQPLEHATRQRLTEVRAQALQHATASAARDRLLPALVLASCVAIAVLALLKQPWNVPEVPPSLTAFEIISSEDELEMFEELEFYAWLALQADSG